jgi:hypothetical protein
LSHLNIRVHAPIAVAFRPLIACLICSLLAVAGPCVLRAAASFPDSEAGNHAGDEATIVGKVVAVSKSGKGTIYLNFGDRFPKQIFSGVVLARDQEKVGDVNAYEGKTVAITGRIELWDQKPQIVIRAPEQIKLAEPGTVPAPPPITTTTPPSTPAPTVASIAQPKPTPPPPAPGERKIVLAPNWSTTPDAGDMTRKDLAMLFGGQVPNSNVPADETSIIVYPEIPYLTPLSIARKRLRLENSVPRRTKITTPGMPSASLVANTFSGIFDGGFTSLSLITDSSDQVVSVQLVDDNPRQRTPDVTSIGGYHTYNFINHRVKAANELVIRHEIATKGSPAGVVVVETLLIDPNAPEGTSQTRSTTRSSSSKTTTRQPRSGKVLERSRWFVPAPLVSLILRSAGNR